MMAETYRVGLHSIAEGLVVLFGSGVFVKSRKKWTRIILWSAGLLAVVAIGLSVMSYIAIHRTPDWYQPDTKTEEQKFKLAARVEDTLKLLVSWGQRKHYHPSGNPTGETAQQTQAMLAGKADEAFPISFTDDELTALFNKWAGDKNRKEWFEQWVVDPRLVIRDKQLIIVGKAKSLGLIVSLIFEPQLLPDGKMDLKLTHVLGGVLPLPDAAWSGRRASLEQILRDKLPAYQQDANISSEGVANGDAASAAMNQLMLAMLQYKPTAAVVFVPIDWTNLTKSLPVKITSLKLHDHTLEMTAEQMNAEERKKFLDKLKTADENTQ